MEPNSHVRNSEWLYALIILSNCIGEPYVSVVSSIPTELTVS